MADVIENLIGEYQTTDIAHAYNIPQLPLIYLDDLPEDTDFKTLIQENFGQFLVNPNSKAGFPTWEEYCNYLHYRFEAKCKTHKFDLDITDFVEALNEIYASLDPAEAKGWTAGDLVFSGDEYRQNGAFIFTGTKVEELEDSREFGDYRAIPRQFKLLEYPPNYWRHYDEEQEQGNENGFDWLNNCLWFDPQFLDVTFHPDHVKEWEEIRYVIFSHGGIHYCIAQVRDVEALNQPQWLRLARASVELNVDLWGAALPDEFIEYIDEHHNIREDSVYAVIPG